MTKKPYREVQNDNIDYMAFLIVKRAINPIRQLDQLDIIDNIVLYPTLRVRVRARQL